MKDILLDITKIAPDGKSFKGVIIKKRVPLSEILKECDVVVIG